MSDPFSSPSDPQRDDSGIRWSRHDPPRPYIRHRDTGKETLYSRCTSWIDCLDDRSTLERWKQRIVLLGLLADRAIVRKLYAAQADPDDKALGEIAVEAFEAGDGLLKAQRGTNLHKLSEFADRGEPLPADATAEDRADIAAYRAEMDRLNIRILSMEQRVVLDDLEVTGTFDRLVEWTDPDTGETVTGIGDLKTGRVDYGIGKMAMQLAVYARGELYDGHTGARSPLPEGTSRTAGLIIHLPAGEATCTVYKVDLMAGWDGVMLAFLVREWRRRKVGFTPLQPPLLDLLTSQQDRLVSTGT